MQLGQCGLHTGRGQITQFTGHLFQFGPAGDIAPHDAQPLALAKTAQGAGQGGFIHHLGEHGIDLTAVFLIAIAAQQITATIQVE